MELLHLAARDSIQWMAYCLAEGTLLVLFAWILLRLLPRQNAGTRFVLWFSILLSTIALPFADGAFFRSPLRADSQAGVANARGLIRLPDSIAMGIFTVWLFLSAVALLRVIYGFWQVNQIRAQSEPVEVEALSPAVRAALEGFPCEVSLRLSDQVQVPAAIGFFKPAVVVPRWLLAEISPAELEQVVLHELTHLRRRDDWTNLAQKTIKALLFFHPCVWWIEQRLTLEREMACDDAVLAQSASPRGYAQCLARLAEKSLEKKKIALAQAMVSRMRQLSLRVAQILDVNRPGGNRVWKPAVPLVFAAAVLCGVSAASAPVLVSFQDDRSQIKISQNDQQQSVERQSREAKLAQAGFVQPRFAEARVAELKMIAAAASLDRDRATAQPKVCLKPAAHRRAPAQPAGDYVVHSEQLVITMTGGSGGGQPQMWQVSMWQVSILASPNGQTGKTVPRKKI